MRHRCPEDRIDSAAGVEPLQERSHLVIEAPGRRRLEVHPLFADRARDHLHRASAVVAPRPRPDPGHAAAPGGEQRCVPCEQSVCCQGFVVTARSVEHHLDDTFNASVSGFERAYIDAEATGDRGSDLIHIEEFALDFAAFEHVCGQGLE